MGWEQNLINFFAKLATFQHEPAVKGIIFLIVYSSSSNSFKMIFPCFETKFPPWVKNIQLGRKQAFLSPCPLLYPGWISCAAEDYQKNSSGCHPCPLDPAPRICCIPGTKNNRCTICCNHPWWWYIRFTGHICLSFERLCIKKGCNRNSC